MPESFPQVCRGTSRKSDTAGGEKVVREALQWVLRLALVYSPLLLEEYEALVQPSLVLR